MHLRRARRTLSVETRNDLSIFLNGADRVKPPPSPTALAARE
jgi:hypothetical protein